MSCDLKPCPFCGGEAHVFGGAGCWCVACKSCGVTNEGIAIGQDRPAFAESTCFDSAKEAVKAWNRRAERTCHLVYVSDRHGYECTGCGDVFTDDLDDDCRISQYAVSTFCYCPSCGARIVGDDDE